VWKSAVLEFPLVSVETIWLLCWQESDLRLPGDVGYDVENLFSGQARTALRLSHFLSNFLQNIDLYEEYGNLRGDRLLNTEQVFGEVCITLFCVDAMLFISV